MLTGLPERVPAQKY